MVNDLPLAASEIQRFDMVFINIGTDPPCTFLYLNFFFFFDFEMFFVLSCLCFGCTISNTAAVAQDRKTLWVQFCALLQNADHPQLLEASTASWRRS